MKKNLLFILTLLFGISTVFAQINTNAFNLKSGVGDLMIRRYGDGDKDWKYTLSPMGNRLEINYQNSFSDGVLIYGRTQVNGSFTSIDYSSWGNYIGFNTYDSFDYKNQKVAHYGLTRIGNFVGLSGWDGLRFLSGGNQKMIINSLGRVGIGTDIPDEKLTVKGKIHAEEVIVDLNVPADYVFQKYYTGKSDLKVDYVFPKLNEIETFVKENNHLPDMPSAKEIQENGLKIGEMNNLLLQKIEELTLLLIEQDKTNQEQQKQLIILKQEINQLKQK
ncbi:tail fiber protein [Chishuiella sp.]|uniref:tail fiber protein n=1 Tax=Chishuiella sp. TaxID=1969467 RepID=UPI0028A7A50C|nr:tail fiber protein [Chishuiella sp.]